MAKKVSKKAATKKVDKKVVKGKVPPKPVKKSAVGKGVNPQNVSKPLPKLEGAKKRYSREEIKNAVKESGERLREEQARKEREKRIGAPHGIVKAYAGTGKTFTMIVGVLWAACLWAYGKFMVNVREEHWSKFARQTLGFVPTPSEQQQVIWEFIAREPARDIRYLAFNKSIVEEFDTKYKLMVELLRTLGVYLTFSTIHSMGLAACKKAYRLNSWSCITAWKTKDLLSILWEKDLREVEKEKWETIEAICELVRLCKITLAGSPAVSPQGHGGTLAGQCGADIYKGDTATALAAGMKFSGKEVVGEWRAACITDEELDALCVKYEVTFEDSKEDVYRDVRLILDMSRDNPTKIDYEDMLWLPIINQLPMEMFDLLLVDEGQDLNRCQQEMMLRAGKRIILVGDENQAIYGFAGADIGGMDRMREMMSNGWDRDRNGKATPEVSLAAKVMSALSGSKIGRGCEEMRFTETRRCGKAIVALAQAEVPDFSAHSGNCEGKVLEMSAEDAYEEYGRMPEGMSLAASRDNAAVAAGWEPSGKDDRPAVRKPLPAGEVDYVLCRTNAPLVRVAFSMIREGRKCNIKGRDIGKGLKKMVKKSGAETVNNFLEWLEKFQRESLEKMAKRKYKDEDAMVALADKCECLRLFAEGAVSLGEIYQNIDKVFAMKKPTGKGEPEPKPEGTLLCSVHRAKGLEAKRVFILRPDLLPHPKAKSDWAKQQERNLLYVAKTRAIETLVFVRAEKGDNDGADE